MAAINKIALNSPSRQNPSELENAIAGALFDLESNTQDLKATLRPLQFVSAREVRIASISPIDTSRKRIAGIFVRAVVLSEQEREYFVGLWTCVNSALPLSPGHLDDHQGN